LIELLVVLAVVGLVVSLSVPALTGYQQRLQAKATLRQLVGLLSLARNRAMSSQSPHAVVWEADVKRVVVRNVVTGDVLDAQLRVPPAVALRFEIASAPEEEGVVVFRPGGALQGRSVAVMIVGRERTYRIDVTAATGAITVAD
jgi:Tfp pilus assembly protein FimT